jgi:twinfilin-like protein
LLSDPQEAAYVLYALDNSALRWLLISYVPMDAPVRQKFLYGSTKSALSRGLGEQRFVDTLFATSLARPFHLF